VPAFLCKCGVFATRVVGPFHRDPPLKLGKSSIFPGILRTKGDFSPLSTVYFKYNELFFECQVVVVPLAGFYSRLII
jgi:hypothetical protein